MASLPTTVKTPLSLSRAEHWTLHHVLLHCIEREAAEPDIGPPSVAVFRAFAALDAGETAFAEPELEAIQSVLAEYITRLTGGKSNVPSLKRCSMRLRRSGR